MACLGFKQYERHYDSRGVMQECLSKNIFYINKYGMYDIIYVRSELVIFNCYGRIL